MEKTFLFQLKEKKTGMEQGRNCQGILGLFFFFFFSPSFSILSPFFIIFCSFPLIVYMSYDNFIPLSMHRRDLVPSFFLRHNAGRGIDHHSCRIATFSPS